MNRKQWLIAVGIASGVVIWIFSATLFILVVRPRLEGQSNVQPVAEIVYCDPNPETLCIVSFGVDKNDRMLINFMLPDPSFPRFYVYAQHAGTTSRYECQAVEEFPNSVYCSGARMPLGAVILIEAYSIKNDTLLARGIFVVAAIGLPTPISVTQTPIIQTTVPPAEPDEVHSPTPWSTPPTPTRTMTSTPTSNSYPYP